MSWIRLPSWLGGGKKAEPSQALSTTKRPTTALVVEPLPLSYQFQRIGGNLTPQTVSGIIREADTGVVFRLMDLANEARQKDCHLHSVLFTRETGLSSTPWQIKPYVKRGRKKPLAKDQKIADFVDDALRNIFGGPAVDLGASYDLAGFRRLIAHMAGAAYFGFAVSEVLWGKTGGKLVPTAFNLIQPRRFQFRPEDGRLCWFDEGFTKPTDVMADFPAGKFIVHQPRIVGDVACREGLVRPLMWAALFRNWDIRDWMALGELAWKPYRTGTYQKAATTEDIDNLIEALRKVATSGVAAFPETTEFKVEWPKNSIASGQSMHGELAQFFAAEMSKAALGQTLTTEAGARGARSLGEVHDKVREDIAESDSIQGQATIQAQLVAPLVRMNYGSDADVPIFEFITTETEAIETFSKGILNLKTAGAKIPEAWVRDRVGMPAPDDDDEILGADMVDATGVAKTPGVPDPAASDEPIDPPPDEAPQD